MKGIFDRSNYPFKCFYNQELQEIYSFYRQGHAFILNIKDQVQTDDYIFERIT